MSTDEMLLKLETCKAKLDRGEELTPDEKAELEAIGKYVAEVIERFVEALTEAFKPLIENLAKAIKDLWDSLPEETQQALRTQAAPPLKFNLGEGVTPYSVPQTLMAPAHDSEARRADHYPGRGGW